MMKDIWQKVPGLVSETVGEECVILDPEGNQVFRLNRTGSHIWNLCDNVSTEKIVETISQESGVVMTEVLEDILEYLEQLEKAGLVLRAKPEGSPEGKRFARREEQ